MVPKGNDRTANLLQRRVYPLVLDGLYAGCLFLAAPYLAATRRLWHSYGHVIRRRGDVGVPPAGGKPRLWIHGVSVGEVLSVRALVRRIQESLPEWELVFSATSQAGLSTLRNTYPAHPTIEYPFDFSWAVRRALRRVRPDLILIIEHELWPNFLHRASVEGVPVVVVNAQVSDRSIRGYRLLSRFLRWPPPAIVHWCAQNPETQERLRALGVSSDRITVTGNLKYDNPCTEARDLRSELGISPDSWILVAASTHDGEEEILLDVFRRLRVRDPRARLILIPRKIGRVEQLRRTIERGGFDVHLRSSGNGTTPRAGDRNGVILVDTMGELPAFCNTGNVVFVGGTLVPFGGHNVIEPASLGKPVVVGPHSQNFRSVIQDFLGAGAISVAGDAAELQRVLERFHGDPENARAMGLRARQVVQQGGGASQRTFEVLSRLLREIQARRKALPALPEAKSALRQYGG